MGNGPLLGMVCSHDLGSNWPSYMYFFHYFERNTKYYIQHFAACVLSVKIWYWSGKHYANIYLYKYMMLRLHPFADYAIHSNNGINLISDLNVKDKFRLLIVLCIVTAKHKIDKWVICRNMRNCSLWSNTPVHCSVHSTAKLSFSALA